MRRFLAVVMLVLVATNAEAAENPVRAEKIKWLRDNWRPFGILHTKITEYTEASTGALRTVAIKGVNLMCGSKEISRAPIDGMDIRSPHIEFHNIESANGGIDIGGYFTQSVRLGDHRGYVFGYAGFYVGNDGWLGFYGPGFGLEYPHPDRDAMNRVSRDQAHALVDDILDRCIADLKSRKK